MTKRKNERESEIENEVYVWTWQQLVALAVNALNNTTLKLLTTLLPSTLMTNLHTAPSDTRQTHASALTAVELQTDTAAHTRHAATNVKILQKSYS